MQLYLKPPGVNLGSFPRTGNSLSLEDHNSNILILIALENPRPVGQEGSFGVHGRTPGIPIPRMPKAREVYSATNSLFDGAPARSCHVGARLQLFCHVWAVAIQDPWVLDTLALGHQWTFISVLRNIFKLTRSQGTINTSRISLWYAQSLLAHGAIKPVLHSERFQGVYSPLFLVEKKSEQVRPVIDLTFLNHHIRKNHFKWSPSSPFFSGLLWMVDQHGEEPSSYKSFPGVSGNKVGHSQGHDVSSHSQGDGFKVQSCKSLACPLSIDLHLSIHHWHTVFFRQWRTDLLFNQICITPAMRQSLKWWMLHQNFQNSLIGPTETGGDRNRFKRSRMGSCLSKSFITGLMDFSYGRHCVQHIRTTRGLPRSSSFLPSDYRTACTFRDGQCHCGPVCSEAGENQKQDHAERGLSH